MKKIQLAIISLLFLLELTSGICGPILKSSTMTVDSMVKVGNSIYLQFPDSARDLAKTVKQMARTSNDAGQLAQGHFIEGNILLDVDLNYQEALNSFYNAVKYYHQADNEKGLANSLNALGLCHLRSYNFQIALEYFMEELACRKKMKDEANLTMVYSNVGLSLYKMEAYDSAIHYLDESILIGRKLFQKRSLMDTYSTKAACYLKKRSFESSEAYYSASLKLARELGDTYYEALALYNMGAILAEKGDLDQAERYYHFALNTESYFEDEVSLIYVYKDLADLQLQKRNYDSAIAYYQLAMDLDPSLINPAILAEVYQEVIAYYQMRNDYQKIAQYSLQLNEVILPLTEKYETHQKLHESFKAERVKYQYEQDMLAKSNALYISYVKWLIVSLAAVMALLLLASYFVKKLQKTKTTQRNLIAYLKERDFFIHALCTRYKMDISAMARSLEREDPTLRFKSL